MTPNEIECYGVENRFYSLASAELELVWSSNL